MTAAPVLVERAFLNDRRVDLTRDKSGWAVTYTGQPTRHTISEAAARRIYRDTVRGLLDSADLPHDLLPAAW